MSLKSELFFPGWWKFLLFGIVCGIVFHLLCGCSSTPVLEPRYPEYDKWWESGAVPRQVIEFDGPYAKVSHVLDVVGPDGTTNSIPVEVTPL